MPVERVSSIYDLASLKEEQEKFIKFIQESKAAIIDLNNQRVTAKGSDLGSFTKSSQDLNNAINNTTTATQKAAKAKQELTAAEIENRLATQQRTASIKNDILETKSALGSYNQLQATLKRLTDGYKAMSLEQRNSSAGKEVKQSILDTKNVLKSLDSGVGDHQRNVGNYFNTISEGFKRVATRAIEYIAVYAGVNAIKDFFTSVIEESLEAEKAAIRFKGTLDNLGRVDAFDRLQKKAVSLASQFKYLDNDEITGVFEKLVTYGKLSENQINELTPVIINFAAKTGQSITESASLIIKALEGNGKALKEFGIDLKEGKTEAERYGIIMTDLAGKVTGAADAFGETTQGKIAATQQRFKDLKEEIGTGLLPVLNKVLEGVNGLLTGFKRMSEDGIGEVLRRTGQGAVNALGFLRGQTVAEFNAKQAEMIRNADIVTGKGKYGTEKTNAAFTFIDPGDTIINGDKAFGKGDEANKAKEKQRSDNLQKLKASLNTEFDIYKIHQEALIKTFEDETKDEKNHYLDKLIALDNYVKASKELLDKEEANEIANKQSEAEREIKSLQEEKAGKSAKEKGRINENIKVTEKNLRQEILLIQADYAQKSTDLVVSVGNSRQDILDKQHDREKKNYEDFLKEELDAQERNDAKILEGYKKREEAEAAAAEKKKELLKDLRDSEIQFASDAGNAVFDIATSSFDKQLNIIKEQQDAIDKKKESDLAANDALVQSEQDKAANITIINSRAASDKEALDRKAAQIELRKAQFERAQQLFEISIETIKALAKIKLQAAILAANPLTVALAPLALAQIPIVLGTSALEIAALFAKPIPKYKGGRGEGKEEFALVHQGEYIHRGDGLQYVPQVETLTHLMPKDKVYKDRNTMMRELAIANLNLSNFSVNKEGNFEQGLKKMTSDIVGAVESITIPASTLITKEGWRYVNNRNAKYDQWVNKNIKN